MNEAEALFRPGSLRILEALLSGPKSLRSLAHMAGLGSPAMYRYLEELERAGIIRRSAEQHGSVRISMVELVGGSLHLDLRPGAGLAVSWLSPGPMPRDFPLASQVRDVAARRQVVAALGALRPGDRALVVLFGSFARGEQTWKSDIDLLFVSDEKPDAKSFQDTLDALEEALDHRVQVHFATRDQFLRGARTVDREAAEDGMVLHDGYGEDGLWARMARYKRISL